MCPSHYQRGGGPASIGLANGATLRTFEELMLIETDECIPWPHGKLANGYGKMTIGGRFALVHQEALRRTVGEPPPGMEACHGPTCARSCMNYRHLRWDTRSANSLDRHRDGTCTQAKLTPEQVYEIRHLADARLERVKDIAERYGIHADSVRLIRKRQTWRHLPERTHE
jgi:hypothetical protein